MKIEISIPLDSVMLDVCWNAVGFLIRPSSQKLEADKRDGISKNY